MGHTKKPPRRHLARGLRERVAGVDSASEHAVVGVLGGVGGGLRSGPV